MKSDKIKQKCITKLFLFVILITVVNFLHAQDTSKVNGTVIDQSSKLAIPHANIILLNPSDSTLVCGTISNTNGEFSLATIPSGLYNLRISIIGYEPVTRKINMADVKSKNLGTILLKEKATRLGESIVIGQRIKAKTSIDKITFFINKKIYNASNTGVDILKHIPGVKVDLMQNISLEGSQNILILVDGKERDKNFLNQLDSKHNDKVEVVNVPDSKYDANVTGVINIILKKNRESGLSGHIYAEIPTRDDEIYLLPNASLNYSYKKINLYASYNGQFSYFDIVKNSNRDIFNNEGSTEIVSYQQLEQKNWSHRINYGIDYFLENKNQFNFYAYYNPYSFEHDGYVNTSVTGDHHENGNYSYQKDDTDKNHSSFYSLYFKHLFNKPGREIAIDLSYYDFNAENTTSFESLNTGNEWNNEISTVKPQQNTIISKIDFTTPISNTIKLFTGVKTVLNRLKDREGDGFRYYDNIVAAYGGLNINSGSLEVSAGLRCENSVSGVKNDFRNHYFDVLPHASLNIKLTKKQNLKLLYRYSIYRPSIYRLNPNTFVGDPYCISKGNPNLKPEYTHNIVLDYSIRFKSNYIFSRLFYSRLSDAMNTLTFINEDNYFETHIYNLGDIHKYGIQVSGSINIINSIAVNPYLKVFEINSKGNDIANQYNIIDRRKMAMESGISAIVSLGHDITASFLFQYNTPDYEIQKSKYYDALYFISLEKTFKKNFKIGITTAVPFANSITYYGTKINGKDFKTHTEGDIKMSNIPFWFKLRYQFNVGKKGKKINRKKEEINNMRRKGF